MRADIPKAETNRRYTVAQAAALLDVSTRTVQRYIKSGTMRAEYRKSTNKRFVLGQEIVKIWNETI